MNESHLDPDTLLRLRGRDLSYWEEERALDHLAQCATCRALLEAACGGTADDEVGSGGRSEDEVPNFPQSAYSGVLDGLAESLSGESARLEDDRASVGELIRELEALSPEQKCLMVRNSSRFHRWALVERLLEMSQEGWSNDPERCERYAEGALQVAAQLRPDGFRARLLEDLKAEAWSYVANCRRIRSDLYGAQEAFRAAWECSGSGSEDMLTRARILELESSLKRDAREFNAAEQRLVEANACYRRLGEEHLQGRVLMNVANLLWMRGEFEESLAAMRKALRLLDLEREPSLYFLLQQNTMLALLELGKLDEARAILPEVRRLARSHARRIERIRLRWAEGILFTRLGQYELAEEVLRQVREGFIAAGIGYEVALVSLDLAAICLEGGRTAEVRQLASETSTLFASRGVHREALAAWNLFRRAADREVVTLGLLDEVTSRIRQAKGAASPPETPSPDRPVQG